MGAYTISGLNLPQNAMIHSVGPYVIPHLDLRFRGVVTTTTPVGAYRGAGRPYGTAVIERAMDALARELAMDPIQVRRRNLIPADRHPYATGLTTAGRGPVDYDSGDYARCMDLALETLGLAAVRREQARLRAEGRYLGVGVVNYVEATATVPLESAIVRVRPDGGVTVVSGAAHAGQVPGETAGLEHLEVFNVAQSSFANGTHAVVLEVDPETGAVSLLRWVVAHDCGRVLQPMIVDGQIHGGVVQGIADALNVQLAYDETGQRLTATLMDYALATAADAPRSFELRHLESPTPLNPLGAKGAGEGGIMPVHPLIAQAIEDALAPFGARVERVPVTRAEIAAMARHGRAGPA